MGASKYQIEKHVGKSAVDDSSGYFTIRAGNATLASSQWFKKCLPCYLKVQPDRNLAGEVTVFLWGYGNGPLAKKSVPSRFGLRLGPEQMNDLLSFSSSLSFETVLDPKTINLILVQQYINDCKEQHGAACVHGTADLRVKLLEYIRLIDV